MTNFDATPMRRRLLFAAIAQALVIAPLAALAANAAPDAPQATSTAQSSQEPSTKKDQSSVTVTLKEVTVTAQRREQNLQVVPVSVSALDETQLERRGIENISDMGAVAPSLVVTSAPGTATGTVIGIRGAVRVNPALYWDTPVGMYLDGVYLGKTAGNTLDLLNLERVEVLRGPQGTLFGRNTMAGAVNLVTRKPSGVFTGDASVTLGNYGEKVAKMTTDLPAIGKLKASVGMRAERRDGWVKATPGSSVPELGNRHNNSAFAALEYDATDDLTFNYRFDYTNVKQASLYFQPIHSDVDSVFHVPGIVVLPGRQDRASVNAPVSEKLRVAGNALTVDWKLGDVGTLKYIGAYRRMHWADGLDLDGSPLAFAQSQENARYQQISHELQYLGSIGRWNWVTGLYYFEDDGFDANPQQYFFGQAKYVNNNYSFKTKSRAIYGQVDYKLTDKLTVTAGLRRTDDDKSAGRSIGLANPPVMLIPFGTHADASFGSTTPALTLTYQLTPTNMVYARYAKGYLGGGFNGSAQTVVSAITPFKPQTQDSYELGTKNTFLDNRLSVNAGLFYNKVDNLQQSVFTANGAAGSVVLNVGQSHSEGAELEAHMRATEDLTLGLNYSYLHAKYDKFMQLGVNIADNEAVQFAPRHTASFVLDDVLLRTGNGTLRAMLDYRFTSRYYLYVFPLKQVNPPSQLAGNNVISAYGELNARLAYGDVDLGWATGEIALWVKNATNKQHIQNIVDFGPSFANLRTANYADPRTFGVTFTARW